MPKKLAIYIHFPFCTKKCNYCNFYSIPYDADYVTKFCRSLRKEISNFPIEKEYVVTSIYIGGGSPSLFPVQEIISIINHINNNFSLEENLEFTLEVNPYHVTKDKAINWKLAGVNRISLGAQSFNSNELKELGRLHNNSHIFSAYESVKNYCSNNISIDLMYGIPEQTMISWLNSIEQTINLKPKHISSYCLKMEKGTYLEKNKERYTIPGEDKQRNFYYKLKSKLKNHNFMQYEISNFSLPHHHSRHNLHVWEGKEYIGFGPAAHSFYKMQRVENIDDLDLYIQHVKNTGNGIDNIRKIDQKEFMEDKLMLGLRLNKGISIAKFNKEFNINFLHRYSKIIQKYQENGFLEINDNRLQLTDRALFISNTIISDFL